MSGFLHRSGRKIIDGDGNEILLIGWGLGNLYVKEGYMWGAFNSPRFDRSRRIEQVLEELTERKLGSRKSVTAITTDQKILLISYFRERTGPIPIIKEEPREEVSETEKRLISLFGKNGYKKVED